MQSGLKSRKRSEKRRNGSFDLGGIESEAECEHLDEWNVRDWTDDRDADWLLSHRTPNKSLIRENLRNVARMGFRVANEVK